jgi:hypothetical protein
VVERLGGAPQRPGLQDGQKIMKLSQFDSRSRERQLVKGHWHRLRRQQVSAPRHYEYAAGNVSNDRAEHERFGNWAGDAAARKSSARCRDFRDISDLAEIRALSVGPMSAPDAPAAPGEPRPTVCSATPCCRRPPCARYGPATGLYDGKRSATQTRDGARIPASAFIIPR